MVVRWILVFSITTHIARTISELREVQCNSHVVPPNIVSRIKVKKHAIKIDQTPLQRSIILADIPRGGGGGGSSNDIILNDNDTDDGMIVQKIKHMIRSLLQVTKDVPVVQGTLSSLIQWIESSIGIRLLPDVSTVKSVGKKKKNQKRKNLIAKVNGKDASSKDGSSSISEKTTKVSNASKDASKKKPKVTKSKSVSAETSMQVKKDLKATNPNYRIQQELKSFLLDPPQHLSVRTGKNIRIWIVTLQGIGIYDGEIFRLRIQFPNQYPTVPPSVYFLPPNIPIHEHVYTNGDICLSLLGKDWRPTMTAQSVAHSILSILTSATSKTLPMDNARHAGNQPGQYQENWVYHDDNC